ncbi:RagB/SusD family nutrient uptake outer membrane protein [Lutibacter sp. HS1-25]|uniref:RagB/SusD family nutrient uptake outer membrane protein n=1 Tax=Lutibacter sp. HS1-25 TaxID=2485000 RepID=UPI001010C195|nr:RagB/SusD family nutrient uptake outer membrane protein [Lutibacter sp. HS1-25]RXP46469.1 RagB/SusD family nutrient uptake outer membrane protein [Lutibacter sp. HS1-25]
MKLNKIIVALAVTFTCISCEDYLDLSPISEETSDNAYNSASQIEAALTGAYESFQSSDYYIWDNVLFQDVRSDNYYAGGDNPEVFSMDFLTISPTNSKVFGSWSNLYNAIAKANTVIDKVEQVNDVNLTEVRRKQISGEAYFLRAYHYYNLVKSWGGVPLVLEAVKSANPEDVRIPRASAEQVYEQIIVDLQMAASLLPDTYGNDASVNKARATAGAANALAAKACLQKPNPDYSKALAFINKVETSAANYTLINYKDLFDGNHYNNNESILEVQFLGGDEGNWGPQLLLPPSISGDTWRKFVTPSHNLVDAFDSAGDVVRKNATILFEKVQWIDEYWGNEINYSIPFGYKWKNANGWASPDRQYILRYGDIVLLKAEALNESGQLDLAAAEVNRIRTRVSLPELTSEQKASKEVLRNTILNERRLELAQEAQRWDDLVRYGVAVSTMNNLVEIDLRTGSAVNYNMTEAKILLPIPQQELDRNPALVQNPL